MSRHTTEPGMVAQATPGGEDQEDSNLRPWRGQEVHEKPSQPIKAGCGSAHLSSWLHGEHPG
jgi:hypothetical protein